jgi:SAM-dependent methyltransferase
VRLEPLDNTALRHVDNRYYDGVHYDSRYEGYTGDIAFWTSLAASGPRDVLELAAGTGRLAFPIAATGAEVVGLDISVAMLNRAVAKAGEAGAPRFLCGDMRDFDLGRTFGLVMIACSSVCHLLSDEDALMCFRSARRHLRPGGLFALDLAAPDVLRARCDGRKRLRFRYPNPDGDGEVVVHGARDYDPLTRIVADRMEYTFTAEGRTEQADRQSRVYAATHLRELLSAAGLQIRETYGSFTGEPLTSESSTQIFLCTATENP